MNASACLCERDRDSKESSNSILELCDMCVSPVFQQQGEKCVFVRHYLLSSKTFFSLHVVRPTFMFFKQQHYDYSSYSRSCAQESVELQSY